MLSIRKSRPVKHFKSAVIGACLLAAAQTSAWAGAVVVVGGGPPPWTPTAPYIPPSPPANPVTNTTSGNTNTDPSFVSPTTPVTTPTSNGFTISGAYQGRATDTTVSFFIDTTQSFTNVAAGYYQTNMSISSTFADLTHPAGDGSGSASVSYNAITFVVGVTGSNGSADAGSELLPSTAALSGEGHSGFFYFSGGDLTLEQKTYITFSNVQVGDVLQYDLPQGGGLDAPVPEPSSLALLGIGASGLVVHSIRRRRQTASK